MNGRNGKERDILKELLGFSNYLDIENSIKEKGELRMIRIGFCYVCFIEVGFFWEKFLERVL